MSGSAFFSLLLTVLGFLPTTLGQKKNWIEFKKDNYQITYPETWILDTSHVSSTEFIIKNPQTSSEDQFKENLNLVIQDLKGLNFDLDNFTALSEQQIQNYMQESEILENERLEKNGFDCQHLIYTATSAGNMLRFEQYYWIIKEKAYVLSFTAEFKSFEDNKNISNNILDSFIIK